MKCGHEMTMECAVCLRLEIERLRASLARIGTNDMCRGGCARDARQTLAAPRTTSAKDSDRIAGENYTVPTPEKS